MAAELRDAGMNAARVSFIFLFTHFPARWQLVSLRPIICTEKAQDKRQQENV